MTELSTCPHCGAGLSDEDARRDECSACGREIRPSDEDRALTPDELSQEADVDSFPASDPPAWS